MANTSVVLTPEELLEHWQGHRRVTRRLIDAFPEQEFFNYSVGGMRPFGQLATELLRMAVPIAEGVATGNWVDRKIEPKTKSEVIGLWDADTEALNRIWKTIPEHRFQEVDTAFGQWKGNGIWMILYAIDNEVHHRGQGYVYLRALGAEPPAFYDRS
ncbi:MAG TPA: DinB family protein [Gemmatimonadaceae bacterium]|jgi:uncharacterized damage-inducible protein DinB